MNTPQAQNLPRIITREETIKMLRELAKNNKPLKLRKCGYAVMMEREMLSKRNKN